MNEVFHTGERVVQERAGVRARANRVGGMIQADIVPAARDFLEAQPMAIAASVTPTGAVWASLLTGREGFLRAVDAQNVYIGGLPHPDDPLALLLEETAATNEPIDVGLLVIEVETRRRIRLNGKAGKEKGAAGFYLEVRQAYANCPKYIQARTLTEDAAAPTEPAHPKRADRLSFAQSERIAREDTFFIASHHPAGGADASHRGGNPGFVRVLDDKTLQFPDYAGNNLFNTLGNLAVNPHAGLLFVDFANGTTLQLTGTAEIVWEGVEAVPGAERLVVFRVEEVRETPHATRLRGGAPDYSPYNPA